MTPRNDVVVISHRMSAEPRAEAPILQSRNVATEAVTHKNFLSDRLFGIVACDRIAIHLGDKLKLARATT